MRRVLMWAVTFVGLLIPASIAFGGWFWEGYDKLAPAPMVVVHSESDLPLAVNTELSVGVPAGKRER